MELVGNGSDQGSEISGTLERSYHLFFFPSFGWSASYADSTGRLDHVGNVYIFLSFFDETNIDAGIR